MLYAFGFDRLAVLASDLYFLHADPPKGQEGAEHGVRLELRHIRPGELKGSIYSSRPISVDEPIWRADLLESVDGRPGSFDRTHHHPRFSGWNESERAFEEDLFADPVGWLGRKLSDLPGLLAQAGVAADTASPDDLAGLRLAVPEILDAVQRMLARVRAGELGRPPLNPPPGSIRASWL
ncbi:hypothetical protein POF50_021015 [Streptomyces sp. SL13]|uniref:Uncharacterized protein n=1 Tax=Streptantibioticus silvisoli TaxID=2705255 RepID=A0AA90H6C7_9ACTN|nr:hypothetical protein [Streptantibioticus silvisoli]MDI5964152.1 hypothetical protein [Streptantibioticus silvisoli]MDI5971783.1 hypothetical protein [Streptantibioticus silvisoli]